MYIPKNQKAARRPEVTRAHMRDFWRSFLKTLAMAVAFCAVIFGISLFMRRVIYSEDYRIKDVDFRNNNTVDNTTISKWAGLRYHMYYYTVDLNEIKNNIERHPDIKEARVEKRLNDKLIITVKEREPVAVLRTENGSDAPIDDQGYILSEAKLENQNVLPVIITKGALKCKDRRCVDEKILAALSYVKVLKHGSEKNFLTIKTVDVRDEDAIIFKTASIDEILLEKEYSSDAVAKVFEVIRSLHETGRNAVKIDARYEDMAVVCKHI